MPPAPRRPHLFTTWPGMALALAVSAGAGLLLLLELRAGPLIAAGVAVALYAGLVWWLPSRAGDRAAQPRVLTRSPAGDPRRAVLDEAQLHAGNLARSAEAARGAGDPAAGVIADLAGRAAALVEMAEADAGRLASAGRFFSLHLPAAADLAADRVRLGTAAGPERLAETLSVLERLAAAFGDMQARLVDPELRDLDLDLELIDKTLSEDGR